MHFHQITLVSYLGKGKPSKGRPSATVIQCQPGYTFAEASLQEVMLTGHMLNVRQCLSTPQQIITAAEGSGLSLGNMWPEFAIKRGSLPSSKRNTSTYRLLFLPPVVWSWEGPVFGVGVGPLFLVQSKLSLVACFHSQKSTSNVQDILQAVGAARKTEFS